MEVSREASAPKSALLQKDSEGNSLIKQVLDEPVPSPSSLLLACLSRTSPTTRSFNSAGRALDPGNIHSNCQTKAGLNDLLRVAPAAHPAPSA